MFILHTTRSNKPQQWEWRSIEGAVTFAVNGAAENTFVVDRITDEEGKLVMTQDDIMQYAVEHDI